MVKLRQALLGQPKASIYQVDLSDFEDDNFLEWDVTPINAEILAAEYVQEGMLDGLFLLKALFLSQQNEPRSCYLDVSMPERISDSAYFPEGDTIIRSDLYKLQGEVIPLVAIEGFGVYDMFYSHINPEVGLNVLRQGLSLAKRKSFIAADMGYILRDEQRHEEAISAFTIAIEEDPASPNLYIERAMLMDLVGDERGAQEDWAVVEKLAGREVVKHYKGS
jgi:hypothetical protein